MPDQPPVDIPLSRTNQPGAAPGEGTGRLLNCYFEIDQQISQWRPTPGLVFFTDVEVAGAPRGMHDLNGTLYDARQNRAVTVTTGGTVSPVPGTLNGSLPVSWAHNQRDPTATPYPGPNLVVVSQEVGAFLVDPTTGIGAYPDTTLPLANSVAMLDGYFLFTTASGFVWASGVNDFFIDDSDHTQNALSFAKADMSGGLVRGTVWAEQFFAWGQENCTVYVNAATYPFPLSRTAIIPVGLLSFTAITGFEAHWGLQQFIVANDNTVRRLDGYTPTVVSPNDLTRLIEAVVDKTQIELSCYTAGGRAVVVVSGPTFTWELNALTGVWNERQSPTLPRWRGSQSVNFQNQWVYGDISSTQIFNIASGTVGEAGVAILARVESGAVKNYPARGSCGAVYADFTTGEAPTSPDPDAANPQVAISTSKDGGGIWSNPIVRRALGAAGDYKRLVRVNRIGGRFTQHGLRFRFDISSPVYWTLRGARADISWFNPP